MFKKAMPFFLHVITPLHAGSGSDLGVVDLPIQRERHTGYPKVESSSLKGCIREAFEESGKKIEVGTKQVALKHKDDHLIIAFGPEDAGNDAHAGALGLTDARILLFPVKSMRGVFAWVTSPKVIDRFYSDIKLCDERIKELQDRGKSLLIPGPHTVSNEKIMINNKVVLEEFAFEVTEDETTKYLADKLAKKTGIKDLAEKMVVLGNDEFRDFVDLSTEVVTRTRIDNATGTVKSGALFTEEFLPAETVMYSLALFSKVFAKKDKIDQYKEKGNAFFQDSKKEEELLMEYFENGLPEYIQLGGDATIGKGIVRTKVWGGDNK